MRTLLASLAFLIWMTTAAQGQAFETQIIKNNGATTKRINLVFLADGYTSAELAKFTTDVTTITNKIFAQTPFKEYEKFFNVFAVKVPSMESGAKHPGTATDVTEPASPVTNPNNYFGSRYDVSNIHRLLVPSNTSACVNVAASNVPDYDQIFVLVNSTVYGGSGGTFATASTDASAAEVAIHEIGHSFAALGDEYWFTCGEAKNRTANNNTATVKWKNWLNSNGVGVYLIESSTPNCYRPHQNCKMRVLNVPFCSVCTEGFIDKIYSLVSPIDAFSPTANTLNFTGTTQAFSLTLVQPNPNTLKIEWVLNGTVVATSGTTYTVNTNQLNNGSNTLVAKVTDGTGLSRIYQPANSGYLNSIIWTINKTGTPVIETKGGEKIHYDIFPNPVEDVLSIHLVSQTAAKIEVNLFDMAGRMVKNEKANLQTEWQTSLSMRNLASGNYFLRLKVGEHLIEKTITKL
jgi:hypothetical protein